MSNSSKQAFVGRRVIRLPKTTAREARTKREERPQTSSNNSLRQGCFLVLLFCSRNFFTLLTINCMLKS